MPRNSLRTGSRPLNGFTLLERRFIETGHNVDLFNRKIVCEDHFTEQYFKKDLEHSLLGNSCTDIKPRTRSSPGQFHTVTVKRDQLSPNVFYFAIIFD